MAFCIKCAHKKNQKCLSVDIEKIVKLLYGQEENLKKFSEYFKKEKYFKSVNDQVFQNERLCKKCKKNMFDGREFDYLLDTLMESQKNDSVAKISKGKYKGICFRCEEMSKKDESNHLVTMYDFLSFSDFYDNVMEIREKLREKGIDEETIIHIYVRHLENVYDSSKWDEYELEDANDIYKCEECGCVIMSYLQLFASGFESLSNLDYANQLFFLQPRCLDVPDNYEEIEEEDEDDDEIDWDDYDEEELEDMESFRDWRMNNL